MSMITQDRDLIFEAYKAVKPSKNLMLEAPTEPGDQFDAPIDHTKIVSKDSKLNKYLEKVPEEARGKASFVIIAAIKDLLKQQANKTFSDDFKAFREKIASIIKEKIPAIDKANAGYAARVIQSFLIDNEILKDERNGKLRLTKGAAVVDTKSIEAEFEAALKASAATVGTSAPEPGDKQKEELSDKNSGLGGLAPGAPNTKPVNQPKKGPGKFPFAK